MATRTSVTDDEVTGNRVILREGDEVVFQIPVSGVTSGITGTPTMKFMKPNTGTDLSSTYLTGSMSIIGTYTIQTKQTQNLKAGEWIISVKATIDGLTYTCKVIPLLVKREGDV